jgi:hypothetical protein
LSLSLQFEIAPNVTLSFAFVSCSRYAKLAELKNDKALKVISDQIEADNFADDTVLYVYYFIVMLLSLFIFLFSYRQGIIFAVHRASHIY